MSQENVDHLMRALEAFNRGDLDSFRKALASNPSIVPLRAALETETIYTGPRAVDEFWAATQEDWVDARIDVESVEAYGEQVLLIGVYSGRSRAASVPFDQPFGLVAHYEDGKARLLRTYADPRDAREAVKVSD